MIYSESQKALDESIILFGTSFSYNSANYKGIFDKAENIFELEESGERQTTSYNLVCSKKDFNNEIPSKSNITINSKIYKVRKCTEDEISYTYLLTRNKN
jgi:hypothetical protein